eukprot:443763_1
MTNKSKHTIEESGRSRGDDRHSTESQRTQASPNVPQHRFMEHKSSKGGKDPLLRDIVDEPLTHVARQSTSYPATKHGCMTYGERYPLPHLNQVNAVSDAGATQPPNNNDAHVDATTHTVQHTSRMNTTRNQNDVD